MRRLTIFLVSGFACSLVCAAEQETSPTEKREHWQDVSEWADPTKPLVEQFRKNAADAPAFKPTGLTRADYLKLVAGNVDFWKQHQDENGAIIDPYRKEEFQYSTPCFALAAATLIEYANREDLLESAAKAMDWSCWTLSQRKGATKHEDFYPPPLAHALPLLKKRVPAERSAKWENDLKGFDPFKIYRSRPGSGNWNIVALSGEYLFHKLGLRPDLKYVEQSLEIQGRTFTSPWGLYLEGPMAYDLFPRIWAADMLAAGYKGKRSKELDEVLRRGAITSLFMQSPEGELPMGGRSSHHQWNEAEQALTYEIYGARAKNEGDAAMAAAYKRGARLALASMFKWQRSSGEMFIVKNRVDPAKKHGFEGYSGHSQYNLLPMAMLCIAHKHAAGTEDVNEGPAPADVGGFAFQIDERLHKIFGNAGGMYIEIDPKADLHYDATGLMRVHKSGMTPQIGPSDTIVTYSWPNLPRETTATAAIGPEWIGNNGKPRRLAETYGTSVTAYIMRNVTATPQRVAFDVEYQGAFLGPKSVIEKYIITPQRVEVATTVEGTTGPTRMVWPVFADNGEKKTQIKADGKHVTVSLDGTSTQTFTAENATSVKLSDDQYANRNGWSRIATAEYPAGTEMKLVLEPKVGE